MRIVKTMTFSFEVAKYLEDKKRKEKEFVISHFVDVLIKDHMKKEKEGLKNGK